MSFLSFTVFGQKAKNPRLTGNRGFFKNCLFVQNFKPPTPNRREPRCQMGMQPFTGRCFNVLIANAIFMFNRRHETPFRAVCQILFAGPISSAKNCVVGWRLGARLLQA